MDGEMGVGFRAVPTPFVFLAADPASGIETRRRKIAIATARIHIHMDGQGRQT
jgi:hypothetical protein